MINNEKGFALVIIMAILPAFIAAFIIAWIAVAFIQQDLAMKYACRTSGIEGQKKVAPLIKKLFDLNPESRRLKRKRDELQVKIEAAMSTGQAHMITGWKLELSVVEAQRIKLGIQQKSLIMESNRALFVAHAKGRSNIKYNLHNVSNYFVELHFKNITGQPPTLAVRPDYPDIAPTYSTVPNFANQQALAHEWQYTAELGKPFAEFLSAKADFKKACAVTLNKEFSKWSPQIIKGKFSWKSVW